MDILNQEEKIKILATKDYISKKGINSLNANTIHFFKNQHHNIGEFRISLVYTYNNSLDINLKNELINIFLNIDEKYVELDKNGVIVFDGKFYGSNSPIKTKLKSIKIQEEQEGKKNITIPAWRTTESINKKIEEGRKIASRGKKNTLTKSEYNEIVHLYFLEQNGLINIKKDNPNNDAAKEIRELSLQVNKIGNNINQIAHSLNIIKRKKFLASSDKKNIVQNYSLLEELSKQFKLITKKIISSKLF